MSDQAFDELIAQSMLQRFPAHADLIREGDLPDFLYIVVDGAVDLYSERQGREATIDILYRSSSFILAAVIRDEVYLKSARTLTPCQILMIPAQLVRSLFDSDAAFARGIVAELAVRYRAMTRVLKGDRMCSSTERIGIWLLDTARSIGRMQFNLPMEKRKLASYLGMSAESFSRGLACLESHGVVSQGSVVTIADPDTLGRFVKPMWIEGPRTGN